MEAAKETRALIRQALKGSLATLRPDGAPYCSLVALATEPDGTPLLLLSRLAVHTQNLAGDPRASLLIDATGADGDPLAGARVSLIGSVRGLTSDTARRRFLSRHPGAETYGGFADFSFYAFDLSGAHLVGGFGRIVDIERTALIEPVADATALISAEPDILAHMNTDHFDAVQLYAAVLGQRPSSTWRMTGIDPGGLDLVAAGAALRVPFDVRVTSPTAARTALAGLARRARERGCRRQP